MKNRIIKIVCSVLAFVMAFGLCVGCTGGGGGGGHASDEIWIYLASTDQAYYAPKIREFAEAHPEWEVHDIYYGIDDLKQRQNDALSTRTDVPDLILGGDVHLMSQYRYLYPLDDLIEEDKAEVNPDDFLDVFMDMLSYEGTCYYLPTYFNVSLLFYNKAIFDDEEQAYPCTIGEDGSVSGWTWDQFVTAGKAMTHADSSVLGYSQFGSDFNSADWSQWLTLVRLCGGDVMDDAAEKVTLDTTAAKEGLQMWVDMAVGDDKFAPTPNQANDANFSNGKCAMAFATHTGVFNQYASATPLQGGWDIAPIPTVDGSNEGPELSITAYGIYKESNNVEGAWELLKFLTKEKNLDEINSFLRPTCRKSERDVRLAVPYEDRVSPKNVEVIYDALEYCEILPRNTRFEYVALNYIKPALDEIFSRNVSVASAAEKATQDSNTYLSRR